MTAEVIVMNKQAVAIAADSAVTVTHRHGAKIYNSVNKLFSLTKHQPIGVMIYGNAEYCGIPWETLIKEYRRQFNQTKFDALENYSGDFVKFMRKVKPSREEQIQNFGFLISEILQKVTDDFYDEIQDREEKKIKITDQIRRDVFYETTKNYQVSFKKLKNLRNFSTLKHSDITSFNKNAISELKEFLKKELSLTAREINLFIRLCVTAVKKEYLSEIRSGIVVTGFGAKDFFPKLEAYYFDGMINNRPRIVPHGSHVISNENQAMIRPFAQDDMVYRFMEGVDERYQDFLDVMIKYVLGTLPEILISKYVSGKSRKQKAEREIEKQIDDLLKRYKLLSDKYRRDQFSVPIISAVRSLPKEELAMLAEAFVQITSLKRRMSMDLETVGGPIDVAVISKGDGLVWIKRKHYFEKDLNVGFISSYLDN